jgi:hypothetical protein
MTATRHKGRAAANNTRYEPIQMLTRSRGLGGRATGGHLVGVYRASEPQRCGCCPCRIRPGQLVHAVAMSDDRLVAVCGDCAGAS